jgi:tetratricopeptide (TPR) repeat protein
MLVFFFIVPSDLCQRVFLATDFTLARNTDILFYREGRTGTAIVTRDRVNNCRTVYINGISEVPALYAHQLCFKMIGDLAPMLHPRPEDVLMICFGGGIAAGATTQLPEVKSLTIVDLESSVVEAAKLLSEENNGLLGNPRAHVAIDDGRNYLMMSRRRWPVIVSDATHPKSGDSWVLYTQEFYGLVRERLTDDGVFVQWVPTQLLRAAEFKIIVRTFQSVFPHASLWITHGIDEQCRSGSYSLLAATPGPLKIDVARMRDRLSAEAVSRDLEPFGLNTPAGFLDTFLCAEDKLRRWTGDGPVNTDDQPYTQFESRYARGALLSNADFIEPMEDIWPYLTGVGSEQEAKQLREELALRTKVNRLALQGQLEKAYSMLPDDARYRRMRHIYEQTPRYIETLVGMYWDNPQALDFMARLRSIGPGGVGATAPIYERVIELDPKNVRVLNMLGVMRINAGRVQEAEGYLRRAVRLSPGFADAHYNLGLCLMKEGQAAEAIAIFRRAVEIRPTFRDARIYLAIALHKTGGTQEALAHLHYVLNMDPKDETAISLLTKMEGQSKTPIEDKSSQELSPGRPQD